jgi:hypothetical protein
LKGPVVVFFLTGCLISGALLSSCSEKTGTEAIESAPTGEKALARVGEKYLYASDISSLLQTAENPSDSVQKVKLFVSTWVKQQLLINEAEATLKPEETEIQLKLQKYKYDLMLYELQKLEIQNKLNTQVDDQEIEEFYKKHKADFELKTPIVRGYFLKLPLNSPKLPKVTQWLNNPVPKNKEDLLRYCNQFATSYSLDDSLWIDFEEMVANTPFGNLINKAALLKSNRLESNQDSDFHYFIRVLEYRLAQDVAPLEFARDRIIKSIVNRRKLDVLNAMEERIYQSAKEKNGFEVY